MSKKECIAMLLAGGQGSRLGALTSNVAKPAVSFGGKFRIIDFALSNCANSGISTVGVLTQYRPYLLHSYIGTGEAWNLDERDGGVSILPPYATQTGGAWYEGTADAVTQNLGYIEQNDPEYVLILSGDQLYRMDYGRMLENHKRHNADLTIAVMPVPWEEASRFGIITQDEDERILKFTEKPKKPDSNLASMGIYIFNADLLEASLKEDAVDQTSEHDFGKNIIPKLLADGKRLYTYEFNGFWRDVGTISSYHETSMDLLGPNPAFDLYSKDFPIMSNASTRPPAYVGRDSDVDDCLVANGVQVFGKAKHSILSVDVYVGEHATVVDSVLLPGAVVKNGAHVVRAILGENSVVEENVDLGSVDSTKDTAVIGNDVVVGKGE
ncbi:MAG: glucose-1-phosphate adenylyltransferase [Olsenella sp.]|nr:glucose-1-phosphate adenylyltransferase [Olsenella sp.]MCI1645480.1 glucose-1-phosphate adenylyltransferase [Olsenella sp.]MCI1793638.1 glucose-1-phosphate adenylyltransferase [Olsenella sp.]MCI1810543.1 glucose-1-phosphate adenylyltransferase [Olsenella sp.]MCI1879004.1 glucose-1-phosphate adenylyltransferase [Olsenella sp.]